MPDLDGPILRRLIFGRRYTQDSPVLPDVWLSYGEQPHEPLDLLLTPHRESSPGRLSRLLRRHLHEERERRPKLHGRGRQPARIAYTQTYVVAKLYFDELVRVLLPMTRWWQLYVWRVGRELVESRPGEAEMRYLQLDRVQERDEDVEQTIIRALQRFAREEAEEHLVSGGEPPGGEGGGAEHLPRDLLWMMRIVGAVAWLSGREKGGAEDGEPTPKQMTSALGELLEGMRLPKEDDEKALWLVNRNRPVDSAVDRSANAVKADAARRLFDVSCTKIAWAVIDSGIDARHPAFFDGERYAAWLAEPAEERGEIPPWAKLTRIAATYDFTRVRDLLEPDHLTPKNRGLPGPVKASLARAEDNDNQRFKLLAAQLKELRQRLQDGREVDWDLLEPFLEVHHDEHYEAPRSEHGTHVAGILGADWRRSSGTLEGICPDIRIFDLRVLDPDGPNDEFSVLAALQFIDHLNSRGDYLVVHGANLSLSIRHQVKVYACGRTPVCDECERLVASGVVVVAAAGNDGHVEYVTTEGPLGGYNDVSITDPGNAEDVITVGATHRYKPHTYGVSYFSGRGPTGDGRLKPDLVAPGEKITGPLPDGRKGRKDGTSMAAPHVSGAAALLMARHKEMVGEPAKIKQVLCETATDLGRERYFQGAGMLDVLRALQAI